MPIADTLPIATFVFGVAFIAIVFAMALEDLRNMVLPDWLNLLLALTGLLQCVVLGYVTIFDGAVGAFLGFGVLSMLAMCYRKVRRMDGLGFGDQKLVAAAGLWVGWQGVAMMLGIASISALIFVGLRTARTQKFEATARLPFGPFLGLGACVVWISTAMGAR